MYWSGYDTLTDLVMWICLDYCFGSWSFTVQSLEYILIVLLFIFFFKQKTAYEMRISDWSSDVCSSDLSAPHDLKIVEIANDPWFIPDTSTLLDQLQAFRERREHFAAVVDEYGSFMGVVTLEDILEEIVGDILDEHDVAVAGVRVQGDGSYVVGGTVTIRDLNREFGWSLPDEEASTVAGLVLHEARRIPEVGQEFMFHGFRFRILRRQRNQITLLRLTPLDNPQAA